MMCNVPIYESLTCDNKTSSFISFTASTTTIDLWHTKLGHLYNKILIQVFKSINVWFDPNLDVSFYDVHQLGKLR